MCLLKKAVEVVHVTFGLAWGYWELSFSMLVLLDGRNVVLEWCINQAWSFFYFSFDGIKPGRLFIGVVY